MHSWVLHNLSFVSDTLYISKGDTVLVFFNTSSRVNPSFLQDYITPSLFSDPSILQIYPEVKAPASTVLVGNGKEPLPTHCAEIIEQAITPQSMTMMEVQESILLKRT